MFTNFIDLEDVVTCPRCGSPDVRGNKDEGYVCNQPDCGIVFDHDDKPVTYVPHSGGLITEVDVLEASTDLLS